MHIWKLKQKVSYCNSYDVRNIRNMGAATRAARVVPNLQNARCAALQERAERRVLLAIYLIVELKSETAF